MARVFSKQLLAGLGVEQEMALRLVRQWSLRSQQSGFTPRSRRHRGHLSAHRIAQYRVAQLRERFAAVDQAGRLAWLEKVAAGEIVPGSTAELEELREALDRVIRIVRSR